MRYVVMFMQISVDTLFARYFKLQICNKYQLIIKYAFYSNYVAQQQQRVMQTVKISIFSSSRRVIKRKMKNVQNRDLARSKAELQEGKYCSRTCT
jgi:hypothetical protein